MKNKALLILLISSLVVSSCGMKRALTLPPKDGKEKKRSLLD
jgi:predicted small lipoprotein YifL